MAIYRQVHISFWQDEFVLNLTPEEKFFYLYLMTNSKTTQCGIYELPVKVIEFETGYNNETVIKLLTRFIEYGKIKYCESTKEIMLLNWIKHNYNTSPKVVSRVRKELKDVKTTEFKDFFYKVCIQYRYPIDTEPQEEPKPDPKEEPKPKPNNYKDIFDFYISLDLKKHRTYTDDMRKAIESAMKNNKYDVEYCKTLLERHKKVVELTKNSEYPVRVRGLLEFFGVKAKDAKHLICSEYEEGGVKYERYLQSGETGNGVQKKRYK